MIIVRNDTEILLGRRSRQHVFMPDCYVFPGGRVDAGDARVAAPASLRNAVLQRLTASTSPARARALAMAAIRETYEESGLIVGNRVTTTVQTRSPHWRDFFALGYVPALDKLDYFTRAITPPGLARRFDARFFVVNAKHVAGTLRSNGELDNLRWVSLSEALELPLAPVTSLVIRLFALQLLSPPGVAMPAAAQAQFDASELVELHRPNPDWLS